VSEIKHRTVETNGIRMHIAESGAGPLVVLCHGFPETWYSWRHQLQALAEAGFHAIAPRNGLNRQPDGERLSVEQFSNA
jgi:pimeloyl-ACP methyl ester carboxylesterase